MHNATNSTPTTIKLPFEIRNRYVKFLLVGATNAIVDVVVLNVLLAFVSRPTPLYLTLCNTLAVVAAIANSYWLNRRWTFSDVAKGTHRERVFFLLQALVNIVLNDLILIGLTVSLNAFGTTAYFIDGNLAKLAAMLVSSSVSYLSMRWIYSTVTSVS